MERYLVLIIFSTLP